MNLKTSRYYTITALARDQYEVLWSRARALCNKTITTLELDQYEVLWSRVQLY
jgi:hypothetical protein